VKENSKKTHVNVSKFYTMEYIYITREQAYRMKYNVRNTREMAWNITYVTHRNGMEYNVRNTREIAYEIKRT
jgi:hypothetical protein